MRHFGRGGSVVRWQIVWGVIYRWGLGITLVEFASWVVYVALLISEFEGAP